MARARCPNFRYFFGKRIRNDSRCDSLHKQIRKDPAQLRMRPAPETDKRNGTAEANRKQDFANCPSFAKQNRKYVSRSTAVGGLFCNATARRALERCCNHSRYGGWLWKLRSNNKDNMSPHNSSHSPRAPVLHVTSWLPLCTQRQHQSVLRVGVDFVTKPAGAGNYHCCF